MKDLNKLSKRCLICAAGHNTLYGHVNSDGVKWIWCNKCNRSYDLEEYCAEVGIDYPTDEEIAKIVEDDPEDSQLNRISWPKHFIPMWQEDAKPGIEYLKTRKIDPGDGMYYDVNSNGIVFPYYYESYCVGAQVRFIEPKLKNNKPWKITTVEGTKLGKLFYGWNQGDLPQNIKYMVVTEGAFNAIALQQTLNRHFKSVTKNPYRFIAASGANIGTHREDILRELISDGMKVILAADPDEAGFEMVERAAKNGCITHFSSVSEDNVDWNDLLIKYDEEKLKKEFLTNLRKI